MVNNKLIITKKKNIRGEDGYKVFSIRVREETLIAIDSIASKTNRSRNEIINICLDYAIKNIRGHIL